MKHMHAASNSANGTAAFIVPFYGDQAHSIRYLYETIASFYAQTDKHWQAIIVDDATPDQAVRERLKDIERAYAQKVKVFWQEKNQGQGVARNLAIQWAWTQGYPFLLFNDADDISHPERVEVVRQLFTAHPTVDLVYSTFQIIDEQSRLVPLAQVLPDIARIIEIHQTNPVEGYDAWIRIGTETGFACLPSATAVRTTLAHACPFPERNYSEDAHFIMHVAARGNEFLYTPRIPSLYRIPSNVHGSSHRTRVGKTAFYRGKVAIDTAGFENALDIALAKGSITPDEAAPLRRRFFAKLVEALLQAQEVELAEELASTLLYETGSLV